MLYVVMLNRMEPCLACIILSAFQVPITLRYPHHYPHLASEKSEAIDHKEHIQNDPVKRGRPRACLLNFPKPTHLTYCQLSNNAKPSIHPKCVLRRTQYMSSAFCNQGISYRKYLFFIVRLMNTGIQQPWLVSSDDLNLSQEALQTF